MLVIQRDEDIRVGSADDAAIAIAQGDTGEGNSDVIENARYSTAGSPQVIVFRPKNMPVAAGH